MERKLCVGLLASVVTAACGAPMPMPMPVRVPMMAPVTVAQQTLPRSGSQIQGAYLSIDVRPNDLLLQKARELRMSLGYLDMGQAIPPRSADEYHVTVAYFRTLSPHSAEMLAEQYRNHTVNLTVTGWGVAKQQAAYFSLNGIGDWKHTIQGVVTEAFDFDDPHVTFGVEPSRRQDVHGVPKPMQHPFNPNLELVGDVHLRQGTTTIW